MQIKLLSSVAVGGQHNAAGTIVDFEDALARRLIAQSRAQEFSAPREAMPRAGMTPEGVRFKKAK